jgi:Cys-tRNA(Pro)/Cys-tRNA(Cys) deacylase
MMIAHPLSTDNTFDLTGGPATCQVEGCRSAGGYNLSMPSTPVTRALDLLGVPYQLHIHTAPVHSLEQAARERGLEPGQIVRSLVFRIEGGSFVMVLVAGPAKVSWPRLRRFLRVSRLTTATPGEVLQVTGYAPGAVSPYGLPHPLRVLADRSLLAHPTLSLGAGIPDAGVILTREDLLRTLTPEMGDFTA